MLGISSFRDRMLRFRMRYLDNFAFVHINKTAGSSIEEALHLAFQHKTALTMRDELGASKWAERFTFTFVRNPWDKVASHYAYRVKTNQTRLGDRHLSFREWVRIAYGDRDPKYYDNPLMFMPQVGWVNDESGNSLVTFVGRFERLVPDFGYVCEQIGRKAVLPHEKKSSNRDFRSQYDSATEEIVRTWFAEDLTAFGYSFDPPADRP
jgi:hypothetical protein